MKTTLSSDDKDNIIIYYSDFDEKYLKKKNHS